MLSGREMVVLWRSPFYYTFKLTVQGLWGGGPGGGGGGGGKETGG